MFPAPTTTAISTPRERTSTISSAIASTVSRSMPYCFEPIRASPESLSRMRANAGAASGVATAPSAVGSESVTGSFCKREALELEHLGTRLGQRLADSLRCVVDPGLVGEHPIGEEALVQHPVDDLLTRLLGLRPHLVRVRVDLALGRDELLGHVLPAHPLRPGGRDLHRDEPAELVVAAPDLDQRTELVRGRVGVAGDAAAVDRLEARGSCDHDVLAELRDELDALVLELVDRVASLGFDELQRLLGEREELGVVRHGLGLAADGDDRAPVTAVGDRVADLALVGLAAGPLLRARKALLAQQLLGSLEVAAGLDERPLAVHHPGPGPVAELLDECG